MQITNVFLIKQTLRADLEFNHHDTKALKKIHAKPTFEIKLALILGANCP